MTLNQEKESCNYLAVEKLFALLRGITKHQGNFYYLNCLSFLKQKINLNLMKNYVKIKTI